MKTNPDDCQYCSVFEEWLEIKKQNDSHSGYHFKSKYIFNVTILQKQLLCQEFKDSAV